MFRIIALLLTISTLLGIELSGGELLPQSPVDAGSVDSHAVSVTRTRVSPIEKFDAEEQALVDFAIGRFDRAGLELPSELTINFPDDPTVCRGFGGLYIPSKIEVRICRPSDTTMIHELAHAWVETTLDDADRTAFLELRELELWVGGPEWDGRGAEHAAEIVTWALMNRDISHPWLEPGQDDTMVVTSRLLKIDNSTHDELVDAYRLLTGTEPADRNPHSAAVETGSDVPDLEARRLMTASTPVSR